MGRRLGCSPARRPGNVTHLLLLVTGKSIPPLLGYRAAISGVAQLLLRRFLATSAHTHEPTADHVCCSGMLLLTTLETKNASQDGRDKTVIRLRLMKNFANCAYQTQSPCIHIFRNRTACTAAVSWLGQEKSANCQPMHSHGRNEASSSSTQQGLKWRNAHYASVPNAIQNQTFWRCHIMVTFRQAFIPRSWPRKAPTWRQIVCRRIGLSQAKFVTSECSFWPGHRRCR